MEVGDLAFVRDTSLAGAIFLPACFPTFARTKEKLCPVFFHVFFSVWEEIKGSPRSHKKSGIRRRKLNTRKNKKNREFGECVEMLNRLVKLNPLSPDYFYFYSRYHFESGEYLESCKYMIRGVELIEKYEACAANKKGEKKDSERENDKKKEEKEEGMSNMESSKPFFDKDVFYRRYSFVSQRLLELDLSESLIRKSISLDANYGYSFSVLADILQLSVETPPAYTQSMKKRFGSSIWLERASVISVTLLWPCVKINFVRSGVVGYIPRIPRGAPGSIPGFETILV